MVDQTQEQRTLDLLDVGEKQAAQTEIDRQARYKAEDAATAAARAVEDKLQDEGASARAAMRDQVKATMAAKANTPEADMMKRIAELEAFVEGKAAPLPEPLTPIPPPSGGATTVTVAAKTDTGSMSVPVEPTDPKAIDMETRTKETPPDPMPIPTSGLGVHEMHDGAGHPVFVPDSPPTS